MRDVLVYVGVPLSIATVLRWTWSTAVAAIRRRRPTILRNFARARDWLKNLFFSWLRPVARRRWIHAHVLRRYCRTLARNHESLIIPGRGVPLPLDDCFIPLELRAGQLDEGSQLLERTGSVIVVGEPGSGKTALMSWLIRTLCLQATREHQHARLPIYVPMYELLPAIRRRPDLYDGLVGDGLSVGYIRPADAFEFFTDWFYLRSIAPLGAFDVEDIVSAIAGDPQSGVVIVLDGLDEIDGADLPVLEAFIVNMSRHLDALVGENLLVITSRSQALDYTPNLTNGSLSSLDTVFLQPYSPAAIYEFLRRWPYRAGIDSRKEAQRIFRDLRLTPTLIESCTNPLFLTLYVSRDQRMTGDSGSLDGQRPETRAEFFADVLSYLLGLRRPSREGMAAPIIAVRRARHRFFVEVVNDHVGKREIPNRISESTVLARGAILSADPSHASVFAALMTLAKDSGIFRQNTDGTWSFIHESIMHFFLGETLSTTSEQKRAIDKLISDLEKQALRYSEGFYFACGLMAWRGLPALEPILDRVGSNPEVFHMYPRSCLEAQVYDRPAFAENIRRVCDRWTRGLAGEQTIVDLIATVLDYENYCRSMGRRAEVSYAGDLREAIGSTNPGYLRRTNVGVEIALRLTSGGDLVELLDEAGVEESVIALYDPSLLRDLDLDEAMARPRVAATLSEAALRSSLLAGSLAIRRPHRFKLQHNQERWPDSWALRESPMASLLSVSLPYVRSLPLDQRAVYPHLFVLTAVRPIRRLRYELLFGEWRVTMLVASLTLLSGAGFLAAGLSAPLSLLTVLALILASFAIARAAVLKGRLTLASTRLLNEQPASSDVAGTLGRRIQIVRGPLWHLPRLCFWRPPRSAAGSTYAAYDKCLPLVWRRFCPAAGDSIISRTAGASVQQQLTQDVKRLIRSSTA